MLKRLSSRMKIGESEKVAKNAVDEHKINGSCRFSSPRAFLKASAIHFRLSIDDFR